MQLAVESSATVLDFHGKVAIDGLENRKPKAIERLSFLAHISLSLPSETATGTALVSQSWPV